MWPSCAFLWTIYMQILSWHSFDDTFFLLLLRILLHFWAQGVVLTFVLPRRTDAYPKNCWRQIPWSMPFPKSYSASILFENKMGIWDNTFCLKASSDFRRFIICIFSITSAMQDLALSIGHEGDADHTPCPAAPGAVNVAKLSGLWNECEQREPCNIQSKFEKVSKNFIFGLGFESLMPVILVWDSYDWPAESQRAPTWEPQQWVRTAPSATYSMISNAPCSCAPHP